MFGDQGRAPAGVTQGGRFGGRSRIAPTPEEFRARDYDPVIGRFISEDPIGFAAGDANLYRYVANMVTSLTDPMGLAPSGHSKQSGGGAQRESLICQVNLFATDIITPSCGAMAIPRRTGVE